MIRCFLPRLFVVVLVFVAPIHAQIRDRSHRRVISGNSILTNQWGHWDGHTGVANSPLGDDVFRAEGRGQKQREKIHHVCRQHRHDLARRHPGRHELLPHRRLRRRLL